MSRIVAIFLLVAISKAAILCVSAHASEGLSQQHVVTSSIQSTASQAVAGNANEFQQSNIKRNLYENSKVQRQQPQHQQQQQQKQLHESRQQGLLQSELTVTQKAQQLRGQQQQKQRQLNENQQRQLSDKNHFEGHSVASRASSSAVHSWKLICEELCGVGLGGIPCAIECTAPASQRPNVNLIAKSIKDAQHKSNLEIALNRNKRVLCEALCSLNLGEERCQCSRESNVNWNKNINLSILIEKVCTTVGSLKEVTLEGCHNLDMDLKGNKGKFGTGSNDGLQTSFGVDSTTTSTTPDWNELCETLCKTGDGGSLCNCDLSPFRMEIETEVHAKEIKKPKIY